MPYRALALLGARLRGMKRLLLPLALLVCTVQAQARLLMTEEEVLSILAVDQDVGLWSAHDRIRCPVLLLCGLHSEVLPTPIAQEMTQRGPRAELVEFPKIGHAPAPTANSSSRALRLKIDQLHAARRR
jgi:pimeloyl-ACP methyl ester carboxylesterase